MSAQRLLPAGWRGSGRRAVWRRARLRRALAAALVGLAGWLVAGAFLPDRAPVGVPVLVSVRDLPAGHRVGASDLRVERWPEQIRPASALQDPAAAIDATLASGLGAGEAVTTVTAAWHRAAVRAAGRHGRRARAPHRPRRGGARARRGPRRPDLLPVGHGRRSGRHRARRRRAGGGRFPRALVGGGDTSRPGLVVALTPATAARLATVTGSDLAGSSITLAFRRS